MSNITMNPITSIRPRFGEGTDGLLDASTAKHIHKQFVEMDQGSDKVIFVSANDKKPETPVIRAQQKVKTGRWALVSTLALSFLGLLGGTGLYRHIQSGPDRVTVAQSQALNKDWNAFANSAREAGLDQKVSPKEQNQINETFRTLLRRTVLVMKEQPKSSIDQNLLNRLEVVMNSNADFVPGATVDKVAGDLENYLREGLKLDQKPSPSDREVEGFFKTFQADFVELTPIFQKLSTAQKDQFSNDVKQTLKSLRPVSKSVSIRDQFKPAISGVLSNGFAGMDWNKIMNLKGEDDAIAVFKSVVSNEDNFREMTSAEREAFLKYGTETLTSLEYSKPGNLYGMVTAMLLLGGFTGAGLIAAKKKNELFNFAENRRELDRALESPVLIVTNTDSGHVEGRRRLAELEKTIATSTEDLAKTLSTVYHDAQYPAIKTFLNEIFGGEAKLPDAAWFKKKFTYAARQDILAGLSRQDKIDQKPVGQLAVWERMALAAESATETGELLPYADIDALEAEADFKQSDADPARRTLFVERKKIDNLITRAMRGYANRVFAHVHAQQKVNGLEVQEKQAEADLVAAHTKKQDLTAATEAVTAVQQKLEAARANLKTYRGLALMAEDMLDTSVKPLKEYRERLSKGLSQQNITTSIEELRQIEDASGKKKTDPALKEVLDKQTVEEFLREEDARAREIEDRVKARVQQRAQAKTVQATASASAVNGGQG